MEVFMYDFSILSETFKAYLVHFGQDLQWCVEMNLILNWEKCHLIVKEGISLSDKVSQKDLEVDKA